MGDLFGKGDAGDMTEDFSNSMAKIAGDYYQSTDPMRKGVIGQFENFIEGGFDPSGTPMYGAGKQAIGTQYNTARDNIMSTLPKGGTLLSSLAGSHDSEAGDMATMSGLISQDVYDKAYGMSTHAPGAAMAGLGGAANSMAGLAGQETAGKYGALGDVGLGTGMYLGNKAGNAAAGAGAGAAAGAAGAGAGQLAPGIVNASTGGMGAGAGAAAMGSPAVSAIPGIGTTGSLTTQGGPAYNAVSGAGMPSAATGSSTMAGLAGAAPYMAAALAPSILGPSITKYGGDAMRSLTGGAPVGPASAEIKRYRDQGLTYVPGWEHLGINPQDPMYSDEYFAERFAKLDKLNDPSH